MRIDQLGVLQSSLFTNIGRFRKTYRDLDTKKLNLEYKKSSIIS